MRYVLSLTHTDQHWNEIIQVLAPQGEICMTDDPGPAVDLVRLKGKAGALHIEMMFARSTHQTPDMIQQHRLLEEVARLVDDGLVKTTMGQHYGTIDAANLRRAHETIESNRAIGKIVLEGF